MGTPIQFGDVVKALEICLWIKRNCFETINNASILYLGFKQDVIDLQKRLDQFQASFEKAITTIAGGYKQAALLKLEADRLVGDFRATLEDCRRLIKKHAHFENGRATALENAFWHTNSQPPVTELRGRLQSHHYKLYLFIEPYKLELLTGIQADTREILDILRRQAGLVVPVKLPEIPDTVRVALAEALQRDAPERIDAPSEIPLQEGVDALSRHYRECTFQSDSLGISPGQQSNLSLLKAHWLYETLTNSEALKDSRPGSLFRRIVEQLGQGIELQYQKRSISSWPTDIYSDLDATEFAIWPVKVVLKPPVLTDPANREEKLAEEPLNCPYPGEKQDLFIFRVNDKLLRMVESRSRIDGSIGPQMTERFIHLDEDRFIPMYAISSNDGNKGVVNMTHGKGAALASYELKSRASVHRVQQAFTGYEAISSSLGVWCTLTYKQKGKWRDSQESGNGEVQLWQEPGSLAASNMPSSPTGTIDSSERSITTGSSYTLASQTFSGFDTRVMSIVEREDGSDMVLSQLPKAPLLVIFVKSKLGYSVWQFDLSCLELGRSRTVENSKTGQQLYRLTLQVPKLKDFPVKRLTALDHQLNLWNLHALHNSAYKTKSKDMALPTVEKLEATGLDLDFTSKQKRERFESHFKVVSNARNDQVHQFSAGRRVAVSQAHRPSRRASQVTTMSRRESGPPTASEVTIRPAAPILSEIPRFSTISFDSDMDPVRPPKEEEISRSVPVSPAVFFDMANPLTQPVVDKDTDPSAIEVHQGGHIVAARQSDLESTNNLPPEEGGKSLTRAESSPTTQMLLEEEESVSDRMQSSPGPSSIAEEDNLHFWIRKLEQFAPMKHDPGHSAVGNDLRTSDSRHEIPQEATYGNMPVSLPPQCHQSRNVPPDISEEQPTKLHSVLYTVAHNLLLAGLAALEDMGLHQRRLRKEDFRLSWICTCGSVFYQDYSRADPRMAIQDQQELLAAGYSAKLEIWSSCLAEMTDVLDPITQSLPPRQDAPHEKPASSASKAIEQGDASAGDFHPAATAEPQLQEMTTTSETNLDLLDLNLSKWLLLCFRHDKHVSRVVHMMIGDNACDSALVKQFKKEYFSAMGYIKSHLSWMTVTNIRFVRFLMTREDSDAMSSPTTSEAQDYIEGDVDFAVLEEEWAPPLTWCDHKLWSPCPRDPRPRAAQRWLMHLWDKPHASPAWMMLNPLRRSVFRFAGRVLATVRSSMRMSNLLKTLRALSNILGLQSGLTGPRDIELQDTIVELPITTSGAVIAQATHAAQGQFFIRNTPQRLSERLKGHPTDPPYGWGLVFEEGIVIPSFVIVLLCFSILVLTITMSVISARLVHTAGYEAFGLGSFTLAAATIVLTMIFKFLV